MRTNIVLDDNLVTEGLRITGLKTKKDLVNYALNSLIERKKMYDIFKFRGKVEWVGNLDEMRKTRKW
jgi:Arc/MetJ family transcription regulator